MCGNPGESQIVPLGRRRFAELRRAVLPVGAETCLEELDGGCGTEDDGIIGLDVESTPGKIRRSADDCLHSGTINDNRFIMLQIAHALPLDVGGAGGCRQEMLCLRFC